MDYGALGNRIRDERLRQRLTQEKLAEYVDKSTNYIGQIERSDGKPSLETIVDIANALGTTVDSLLRDSVSVNAGDQIARELYALLAGLDDRGKLFLLDVARKYAQYHEEKAE